MRLSGLSVASLLVLVTVWGLGGCSSGGGGGGGGAVSTGSVSVLVADGPADEYENIFVTINQVALLPAGGGSPVVVFSSDAGEEIDLLEYRDEDFLLSVVDGVPTGTYEKIRMVVSDARTVGGPCDDLEVRVPSGHIDLNPRGTFDVVAGGNLSIRLDIDANKSIHLHPAGNSGMCVFRPVVFVTIVGEEPGEEERCIQAVMGTIEELILNDADEVIGFVLDLGGDRGLVDVLLTDDVGIFDDEGLPTDTDSLDAQQVVGVRGDINDAGEVLARVVFQGEALEMNGIVESLVDTTRFVFSPNSGEEIVDDTETAVFDETLILVDCEPGDADSIFAGAEVMVTAKLSVAESELRSFVLILGNPEIEGQLISATEVTDGVDIEVIPEGQSDPIAIFVPDGVAIELEGDGAIELELLQLVLNCQSLGVVVQLDPENTENATSVEVQSEDFEGILEMIEVDEGLLVVDGISVEVQPGATILDLSGDTQELIGLDELEEGDRLRLFGLDACPADAVDFYAFVVLVLPNDVPDPEGEGCGPGYWKQSQHFDEWADPYEPGTPFDEVFDDAFGDMTLLEVLWQGGGGLNSLGRHTVAALLNAASPDVDFGRDPESVIADFNDVYPGGDYEDLKNEFEDLNERDCPLD